VTFRVRGALSFAAVALTLAADYWIVHRPAPHGVAEFNPIKATLGREELILANPSPSGSSLLSHQGGKNEVVEVFFQNGVLSDATQKLLADQAWAQSQKPRNISYTTLDLAGATGSPCRTFVNVKAADVNPKSADPGVSELRLFQDGIAGGEDHREFSVRTTAHIQVDLLTAPDDSAQTNQPGCHKLLQAGDHQIGLTGTIPVSIVAEPGSAVRLKFLPASSAPIWKGAKGLFEPFQGLGLAAGSVRRSPIDSQQALFSATATKGRPGLAVDELLAGSDTLEMRLSGVGWVTVNGRSISPTLGEWISVSSLRASLVGFLNLLIFCGAIVFGAGSAQSTARLVQWAAGRPGIHVPAPARGLVVFLCHCSEDKPAVREIDRRLKTDGFQPWLDEDDILPARMWDREIKQGLRSSHAVVVCLSKTFARKEGYVQKELRFAIDLADEKVDHAVFLIPVRLEECEIPASLAKLHVIDWFKPDGHERLFRVLSERARQVGIEPAAKVAHEVS
jgi:hypothetical protein